MLRDDSKYYNKYLERIKSINIIDLNNNLELENKINKLFETNCLSTCNGTSAILLALKSFNLKENDEIILPGFSYHSAYIVSNFLKLNIKFCDISENTLCLDPEKLKNIISDNTKCVVFINHLGYVGKDLIQVKQICDEYKALLLEDSSQAFSHSYNNNYAGTFGDIGIFSFSGTKLLRCGEGGCLVTRNTEFFEIAKNLRDMGIGNYIISPISAKLVSAQIDDLNFIISHRKNIQDTYKKYIDIISYDYLESVHAVAKVFKTEEEANKAYELLQLNNIESRYKFYNSMFKFDNSLEVSERISKRYLELPQSYDLSELEIKKIVNIITDNKININLLSKINKLKR